MAIRIVRLGSPREAGEGLRIGRVRRLCGSEVVPLRAGPGPGLPQEEEE